MGDIKGKESSTNAAEHLVVRWRWKVLATLSLLVILNFFLDLNLTKIATIALNGVSSRKPLQIPTQDDNSNIVVFEPGLIDEEQKLTGFGFCTCLEGATIRDVPLKIAGISEASSMIGSLSLVPKIDQRAQEIYLEFYQRVTYANLHKAEPFNSSVVRFSCLSTILANNEYNFWTPAEPLLKTLDSTKYLPEFKPLAALKQGRIPALYKIAYVILAHGDCFENIKHLIQTLAVPENLVVVHVDAKFPELKTAITNHVAEKFNVHVLEKSYDVMWGHVSIVWAQLHGFYTALDLGTWGWIINLSAADYPLIDSESMHQQLSLMGQDSNWVFWVPSNQSVLRTVLPRFVFPSAKKEHALTGTIVSTWWKHRTTAGIVGTMEAKQSQWMILSRSFLDWLRTDATAKIVLSLMEHSHVPDESYFISCILNSRWKDTLISTGKRLIYWGSAIRYHPTVLGVEHTELVDKLSPGLWFVRKVDLSAAGVKTMLDRVIERQKGNWALRNQNWKKNLISKTDMKKWITLDTYVHPKFAPVGPT